MPRAGNLDPRTIEAAKPRAKPYRLSDGRGLLLVVKPSGARAWIARVTVHGRRRDVGLGGWPDVTLKMARERALEAREMAAGGIDPAEHRKRVAAELAARERATVEHRARSFRAVAELAIAAEEPGWKSARTAALWRASLTAWAYPELGDTPVSEIDRAAVLRAVRPVWSARPATARKVLRRIGAVLRFAAAHGWRTNDSVTDMKMLRHSGLPALKGGRRQPSLPWARVPAFMRALDGIDGLGALALRLAILTALRSGEVRAMRWSWLSFDGTPTLTVPGEVMKGKKAAEVLPHRVPLSDAAVTTLARAYAVGNGTTASPEALPKFAALAGSALVFPSARRTTPLSDMTLSAVVRRLNVDRPEGTQAPWRDADGREAVPHGFRASFSTWVDDVMPHEREAAERALAHEVGNKVSGAYRRSDLFDRRVELMRAWGEVCAGAVACEHREVRVR